MSNGGSAASTSTSSGTEPDLLLGFAESGREQVDVAGLGLAAGQPQLPAMQAAVVRAHDDRDAELVVRVAEDGDQDGGVP